MLDEKVRISRNGKNRSNGSVITQMVAHIHAHTPGREKGKKKRNRTWPSWRTNSTLPVLRGFIGQEIDSWDEKPEQEIYHIPKRCTLTSIMEKKKR